MLSQPGILRYLFIQRRSRSSSKPPPQACMEVAGPSHNETDPQREGKPPQNQQNNHNTPRSGNLPPGSQGNEDRGAGSRRTKPSRQRTEHPVGGEGPPTAPRQRNPKHTGNQPKHSNGTRNTANNKANDDIKNGEGSAPRPEGRKTRYGRGRFNASLTESAPDSIPAAKPSDKYKSRNKNPAEPIADDLASILTHALRTPPYPDCPICFSSIHPAQPTWSCSPSIPVIRADDASVEGQQYCWTTFHVKCIRSWASKSVKDVADAWRARGEEGRRGDWRCPGCQAKREDVPSGYWYVNRTYPPIYMTYYL